MEMGSALLQQHFAKGVKKLTEFRDDEESLFRLLDDEESMALNAGTMSECLPQPGGPQFSVFLYVYNVVLIHL